ncbi:RNA polymerase sigma factor [Singulisphaera rosea]
MPPRSDQASSEQTVDLVPSNDEALLSRYRDAHRAGDLDELFRRYSGELSHYFARYLGDSAMAEDVLQDTFLQVHTKCHLYRDGWPARPWLYSIAMHRAVDALRRARRMPRIRFDQPVAADDPTTLGELVASDDLGPLEELQRQERQEWVRGALSRLAEPHRQVLVLSYYQGLSYAEVAELMDIHLGTVKSRLHTAISRMRTMAEQSRRF